MSPEKIIITKHPFIELALLNILIQDHRRALHKGGPLVTGDFFNLSDKETFKFLRNAVRMACIQRIFLKHNMKRLSEKSADLGFKITKHDLPFMFEGLASHLDM